MTHSLPPIVSRAQWQVARERLLEKEKSHTRAGDALAAERQESWEDSPAGWPAIGTLRLVTSTR